MEGRASVPDTLARLVSCLLPEESWPETPLAGQAAVLIAFYGGTDALRLVFVEKTAYSREHAGQIAFPGGSVEPGDRDRVATALREAYEETGIEAATVVPLGELPSSATLISRGGHEVTPVVGWWNGRGPEEGRIGGLSPYGRDGLTPYGRTPYERGPYERGLHERGLHEAPYGLAPYELMPHDTGEIAAVHTIGVDALLDPANRLTWVHPSGFSGPGFVIDDLFIWGFTAKILDTTFALAGWNRPWDVRRRSAIPARFLG